MARSSRPGCATATVSEFWAIGCCCATPIVLVSCAPALAAQAQATTNRQADEKDLRPPLRVVTSFIIGILLVPISTTTSTETEQQRPKARSRRSTRGDGAPAAAAA